MVLDGNYATVGYVPTKEGTLLPRTCSTIDSTSINQGSTFKVSHFYTEQKARLCIEKTYG